MISPETAAAAWAAGEKHMVSKCARCGQHVKCMISHCGNPKCKGTHGMCEFCFIQGILNGFVVPDNSFDKEDEKDVSDILSDSLFGGN